MRFCLIFLQFLNYLESKIFGDAKLAVEKVLKILHFLKSYISSVSNNVVVQEKHEILLRCIKEDLGFKDGKPVAACIIYRCLLHWRAFEADRTAIFDFIIEAINDIVKVGTYFIYLTTYH